MGRLLMFGWVDALPFVLLAINLMAMGIGTAILEGHLTAHGFSRWLALGYALSGGLFGATRLTTTEPLAYGLVLIGLWGIHRDRIR